MNFQQLRIIREAAKRNFNLTDVANAIYTSQSGVSKHIKDLEDELGIEIFVRKGKRLTGLTPPGAELLEIVDRMLADARNIKLLAEQFSSRDEGQLTIATTHTQACYALPPVVARFREEFPRVHLAIHQGSPEEIIDMLASGEADIGIATESLDKDEDLATFPFYQWHHGVIVPEGHPLQEKTSLTLKDLAEYPVITYHGRITGRPRIDKAFAEAGIKPDIVISALDADVIKTYVELGLGIGIIAAMSFNPRRDAGLALLNADDLFEGNTTLIAVRKGHYLRSFACRFIELCAPALTEGRIRAAVALDNTSNAA